MLILITISHFKIIITYLILLTFYPDTQIFMLAFETACRMLPVWILYVRTFDGKTALHHMRRILFSTAKCG